MSLSNHPSALDLWCKNLLSIGTFLARKEARDSLRFYKFLAFTNAGQCFNFQSKTMLVNQILQIARDFHMILLDEIVEDHSQSLKVKPISEMIYFTTAILSFSLPNNV